MRNVQRKRFQFLELVIEKLSGFVTDVIILLARKIVEQC